MILSGQPQRTPPEEHAETVAQAIIFESHGEMGRFVVGRGPRQQDSNANKVRDHLAIMLYTAQRASGKIRMNTTVAVRNLISDATRWGISRSKFSIAAFCTALVLFIGYVDYITGIWISLSVVYVVPIAIAAWFVNRSFALAIATASTAVWLWGDVASGMTPGNYLIPAWNGFIRLAFYVFVIVLLKRLHDLQTDLGRRVQERAAALTREIAERERLEREMLQISERERRTIGQDLHDGLCQHLTGTALASQVLTQNLAELGLAQADESRKVVDLIEEGITLARSVAKGLYPVEMRADGLMQAFDEFAATTSELFKISCRFECDSPVLVRSPTVAMHLYRIAQEAVSNAIKHGQATEIAIAMEVSESGLRLSISDNGSGIPDPLPSTKGMGLRIIADRAQVIGATFAIRRAQEGGAELSCVLALDDIPAHLANV